MSSLLQCLVRMQCMNFVSAQKSSYMAVEGLITRPIVLSICPAHTVDVKGVYYFCFRVAVKAMTHDATNLMRFVS